MPPFNLQGLNVVHPTPSPAPHIDSQDPLASPFPDFSAHLDLWTNLAFESDEPLAHNKAKRKLSEEEDEIHAPPGLPNQASHENVVHPPTAVTNVTSTPQNPISPPFDLNALLAGFAIEPFLIPPPPPTPVQQHALPPHAPPVPSIAQLLALHAAQGTYPASSPPSGTPPLGPAPASAPQLPAAKRARTQKNSISISTDNAGVHSPPQSPEESTQPEANGSYPSVAEDKRRRNTAASARFRLKKKEREAALERRAKELEERVVELERECEGLRRENGWLKGLVVGVTGAGAAQQQQASTK
ncbi:hypothetical protein BDN67DRAFT_620679 [Paxillus ammoniavirescens]|nr:hypothetical protein BDN67DRAFT_620679 [Paxillus ammoniavirescens]